LDVGIGEVGIELNSIPNQTSFENGSQSLPMILGQYRGQRSWPRRQLFTVVGSATLTAQIDQATNIFQRGPFI
jgi:hypothetical protein